MVPSTHAMMLNRLPKSAIGIIAYVFIPARAVPQSQPGAMGRSDYPPLPALAPSPRPGGPPGTAMNPEHCTRLGGIGLSCAKACRSRMTVTGGLAQMPTTRRRS
jgi:hypothetical protein